MDKLLITVKEIKGNCLVYSLGDRIVLDEGYRFNLKETDNVCMHSLSSIMPYHIALYNGVDPRKLGLSRDGKKAYVQCLDPCDYTNGGTVIFEIERIGEFKPATKQQEPRHDPHQRPHNRQPLQKYRPHEI